MSDSHLCPFMGTVDSGDDETCRVWVFLCVTVKTTQPFGQVQTPPLTGEFFVESATQHISVFTKWGLPQNVCYNHSIFRRGITP